MTFHCIFHFQLNPPQRSHRRYTTRLLNGHYARRRWRGNAHFLCDACGGKINEKRRKTLNNSALNVFVRVFGESTEKDTFPSVIAWDKFCTEIFLPFFPALCRCVGDCQDFPFWIFHLTEDLLRNLWLYATYWGFRTRSNRNRRNCTRLWRHASPKFAPMLEENGKLFSLQTFPRILPFFSFYVFALFIAAFPTFLGKFVSQQFKLHRMIIKLNFKPRANKIKLK